MKKEKIYTAIIKNLPIGFSIVDKDEIGWFEGKLNNRKYE